MKKVISLLLTIAVVFALLVPVSFADAENKPIYGAANQPEWTEVNIGSSVLKPGCFGKDEEDESMVYTTKAGYTACNLKFTYTGEHSRYVILKWNIAVDDLTKFTDLQVQTNKTNEYNETTSSMKIPSSKFIEKDSWHDIKLIIDTKDSESLVYLNGDLFQGWKKIPGQFLSAAGKVEFRLRLGYTDTITFAFDDFEMYTTDVLSTIYDEDIQPAWSTNYIANTSDVNGHLDKADSDISTKYTLNANTGNITATCTEGHYRYLIAKWNVAVENLGDLNDLQVQTDGGTSCSSMEIEGTDLNENAWNEIELIIDTKESKSRVYLNGEFYQECINSGQFLTSESKDDFRLRFAGNKPITFVLDDFEMYSTSVLSTIYDKDIQPAWSNNYIASTSDVNGYLGKAAADESTKYTLNANTGNILFAYSNGYHRYVVTKWNIAIDNLDSLTDLQVQTDDGSPSLKIPGTKLKANAWNNIILVVDTKETKSLIYLNGELFEKWTSKPAQFLSTAGKDDFRLRFEGTSPITFALDDFEMYTVEELPTEVMDKDFKSIAGDYINANGDVYYKSGTAAEDVLADSKYKAAGAFTVIYDAEGRAVTSGNIPASAKLALRTDDSTINTYDLVALNGIATWDNGENAKKAFAFADSGVMIAARYVGGRFASLIRPVNVSEGMLNAQMDYTGDDGEEIKFFVWDSLTGMNPVYPSVTAN